MRRYLPFASALLLDVAGAGIAVFAATRIWQTIVTPRPAPLRDDVVQVSGRTLDAAPTALALVGLAGVVAVLATRGFARRVIGLVLLAAGAALVWRALAHAATVGPEHARALVRARHPAVEFVDGAPVVHTHPAWMIITVCCGIVMAAAGVLVARGGHSWQVMSARYEPAQSRRSSQEPREQQSDDPARTSTRLWSALDRGEDPTD